jgi:energy-coupling factor transport system permease protein
MFRLRDDFPSRCGSRFRVDKHSLCPVMLNEARAVVEAQSARGFELRRMLRPANWPPVAVPLVTNVMKRSNDLAIVIELKGGL